VSVTREQAEMLTELVIACRPHGAARWDRPGVFAAIGKVKGRSLASVIVAAIQAAEDRNAETPGVIASAGPHWRAPVPGDRPAFMPPKADEMCPLHGGYRDNCPGCAADRLAGDQTTRPAPARMGPTDEFRAARAALHPPIESTPEYDAASRAAHPTHPDTESESA
jgi:hypothetical protein